MACAHVASQSPHRFHNLRKVGVFAGAPPFVPPVPLSRLRSTAPSSSTTTDELASRHQADTLELQRDWMIKSKLMFGLAEHLPSVSRAITSAGIHTSSWLYRSQSGEKMIDHHLKAWLKMISERTTHPSASKPTATDPNLQQESDSSLMDTTLDRELAAFHALVRETWAQGADGWLDEVRLLGRPWGFDPSEIRCRSVDGQRGTPVKVWHGSQDLNAPLSSMRWLVDRIPDAELVVLEDKGHFELGDSLNDMLEWAST